MSGSRDKTIKLWNTLGECKYTIQEDVSIVRSVVTLVSLAGAVRHVPEESPPVNVVTKLNWLVRGGPLLKREVARRCIKRFIYQLTSKCSDVLVDLPQQNTALQP